MLVLRFFRVGKKNQPSFKIVVTEKTRPPRAGVFVEEVGFYNPLTKEKSLNAERIKYWISKGVQPSDTVHNLLVSEKVIEGSKRIVKIKMPQKEESEASKAEAPTAKAEPEAQKAEPQAPTAEPQPEPSVKPEEPAKEPEPEKPAEPEKTAEPEKPQDQPAELPEQK